MPDIWTHFLFGQELITELGHGTMLQDDHLRNVFNLGCQGPDFLFYHQFKPWQNNTTMNKLGSLMHTESCGPFLVEIIELVKQRGLYNPAVIYTLGFILHHILDRHMHPYVFYHSGFKKWQHQRFEVILDTLITQKKRQIETWKHPVWKHIYVGKHLPLGVIPALNTAAQTLYGTSQLYWNEAYLDMIQAQKLCHDPYGWKRVVLLGLNEPMVYKKHNPPLDFMNESHRTWNCPTNREEVYTHSVWDLWDIAKADGLAVIEEVIVYLTKPQTDLEPDREKLIQLIGNRSYETGKPCDSGLQIVHVNPMF